MQDEYKKFSIKEAVDERIIYLGNKRDILEKTLSQLPDGNLLVAPGKTENSFRYYNRKSPQDKAGEYLGKEDTKLKSLLAQKKYIAKMLKNIADEMCKLEKIQKMKLNDSIIDAYSDMNLGVRKLIYPVAVDDETFINSWQNIPYDGLGFSENDTTEYFSNKGERMRSKSEVAIANLLLLNNIPYKYECPITRRNGEKLYPDFTILDVARRRSVYWEHLGRMSDASYISKNLWKMEEYKKTGIYLGINLFITFETNTSPMGTNEPIQIINEILHR